MKVRSLGVSPYVQDKFEQAKKVCPMALRKVIFAYKSGRIPNLTKEEVALLLSCEVLFTDCRQDELVTVFNVEMEELFWRTTQTSLRLIELDDMVVAWPDRSDWPWSERAPSSRKSGPISTRRTSSVVGMFSAPREGQLEGTGYEENLIDSPDASLFYGPN